MYHRMYLRRCSMSSISEESETGDDDHCDEEFSICNNNKNHGNKQENMNSSTRLSVENCLGDLNSFKEEIREAYEELSTLERQARYKAVTMFNIEQENELDVLLEQLQTLEQRLDETEIFRNESIHKNKKPISPSIIAQFDELDQALATLTSTLNSVEIELADSGNSSSSSAISESTRIESCQKKCSNDGKSHEIEGDEHFSDSGLSQSTDSISLPLKQQSQIRADSQISNASSVLSCDAMKNSSKENQIRLALEKLYEANIKKMFIKIHNEDKSTKNILIDEKLTVHDIIVLLLHKYRLRPTYNYALVEDIPDLYLYRILEDHQNVINNVIIYWSRDTNNRICFQQCQHKYSMFNEPKSFFSKNADIFNDYITSDAIILPDDIASILYIKDKNRKVWKKYSCILRRSGIYRMAKSGSNKRDLLCLLKFDMNMQLYYANNWIESLRSPTEYGFALKYAHIQKKSTKYIHYLCANSNEEYQRWINGIRIIQYGIDLYKNYEKMKIIINNGKENLSNVLPNQHYFNFINSKPPPIMSSSLSTISLPINHLISDSLNFFDELECSTMNRNFNSLDRLKKSKANFTRSSSFHDSLRRTSKNEEKKIRTCSMSPPNLSSIKYPETQLKRSKSTKETRSKSLIKEDLNDQNRSSSTASIIPFINQCIQSNRSSSPTRSPPPPPLPQKLSSLPNMNHIYDTYQENPRKLHSIHRTASNRINTGNEKQTIIKSSLPPMRVTEL